MTWYLENLQRYRYEREVLETLASSVNWLTPIQWRIDASMRLFWDADIATPSGIRQVSLRYPNHFPHSPPLVLPRGDATRWSAHQYGPGGELCLEYGPDNWMPDITGAAMISSAYHLLASERPTPDQRASVASRHKTTMGQDLRTSSIRLVVTRNLASALAQIAEDTMLSAKMVNMNHANMYIHVIASITIPEKSVWKDDIPETVNLGVEQQIAIFRWPEASPLPSTGALSAFRTAVVSHSMLLPDVNFVVLVQNTHIHFYILIDDDDRIIELPTIPPQPFSPRLDSDHAALAARRVALVGCGSLGSKIAVSLARVGVGKFLLVDDDILLPDNLVRNDLDWRDVGMHKVDSVAIKIALVNPNAECATRKHRLGGQEASGSIETLIESLGECDLLIDGTADAAVFNYLSAAVAFAKKPLLWAEVFGGGYGGLIARHRPAYEPDPATMRRIIENWCIEKDHPMDRATNDYSGGPRVPEIADDADVGLIAAHATRMAVDLLIPRDPSFFLNSVYMVGLAKGWIFSQPFETYPIDVGQPSKQQEVILDADTVRDQFLRIKRLFEEYAHATSSLPKGDETTPI